MKLRVITSVGLVTVLVAAGLWGVQTLSAQGVATPPATKAAASDPAAVAVPARTLGVEGGAQDVLVSAPKPISTPSATITPRPALLPGAVVPLAPPTVDIYAPVGEMGMPGRSSVNDIYGVQRGKVLHFESHLITLPDAIRQTAKELRDATDDAAKTVAQRQLNDLLDKYFEADIKRREAELKQVEQRTKELRALLERRREKKSEIVELQTKVLLNEADGLGFFNEAIVRPDAYPTPWNPQGWTTPDQSPLLQHTISQPATKLYYPEPAPIPGTGRPASELSPPPLRAESQQTPGQPAADAELGIER